ncbi:helix-turn-helix domain-containing protein [Parasedimentitalea psychrophila]|uniref:Helix-turn-helix transcriptional regulator n=1 Tax=Parasedimentitalea psychrophila TaxID=2997337 RepID=A0A9Y2L2U3_9RHOB|nr:helix-turn-helix transcriptional regulator [Parasedimentitalea psychrophila]WIY27725.1 helix-turn-helix transcriptional regulator [Parasedimentitalea psychrophila]
MGMFNEAAVQAGNVVFSRSFQRQISSITTTGFAQLGHNRAGVPVISTGTALTAACEEDKINLRRLFQPGAIRSFAALDCSQAAPQWLPAGLPAGLAASLPASLPACGPADTDADGVSPSGAAWVQFACCFEDGSQDRITLHLHGGQHDGHCAHILAAIWPVLREDILREIADQSDSAVTSALLWTILKKADSAVLVFNAAGRLLHSNDSGRDLLSAGTLLRRDSGGLRCANDTETKGFYAALRSCALSPPAQNREKILFLEDSEQGIRLPISLTCYRCTTTTTPLVVAILPCQPKRSRIEMLAQKMGLSPAEARVAALMQLGLPNREAAQIAGLKEQTFKTYAKRVLSKLHVGCRAEMAQRLTWQASLGRAS